MTTTFIAYLSARIRRPDTNKLSKLSGSLDRGTLKDIGFDPDTHLKFRAKEIADQEERMLRMRI